MSYDDHGIPIIGPPPKDVDAEERAHRESQRTYENTQTALQGRILWTQIGLVVFGLVGALVSVWQARTAQESADVSDRSVLIAQRSERDSVRSAERARVDAKAASDASSAQAANALQATIDNFHQEQRPYLIEKPGGGEPPRAYSTPQLPGKVQIAWNWGMVNFGKSPAQQIVMHQQMSLDGGEYFLSYGGGGVPGGKGADVGGSAGPMADAFDTVFSGPMTEMEARAALLSSSGVSIKIRVTYTDFSGKPYETAICLNSRSHGAVSYCKPHYVH